MDGGIRLKKERPFIKKYKIQSEKITSIHIFDFPALLLKSKRLVRLSLSFFSGCCSFVGPFLFQSNGFLMHECHPFTRKVYSLFILIDWNINIEIIIAG